MNYSQFSDSEKRKFGAMRCNFPGSTQTTVESGWFRIDDSCPCNPVYSNISGRGFLPCTFGLTNDQDEIAKANPLEPLMTLANKKSNATSLRTYQAVPATLPLGSVFPQNQFVPSSYEPRPLIRVGNDIRSAWA